MYIQSWNDVQAKPRGCALILWRYHPLVGNLFLIRWRLFLVLPSSPMPASVVYCTMVLFKGADLPPGCICILEPFLSHHSCHLPRPRHLPRPQKQNEMFNFNFFKSTPAESKSSPDNLTAWNPTTLHMQQPSSPAAPSTDKNVVSQQPVRL